MIFVSMNQSYHWFNMVFSLSSSLLNPMGGNWKFWGGRKRRYSWGILWLLWVQPRNVVFFSAIEIYDYKFSRQVLHDEAENTLFLVRRCCFKSLLRKFLFSFSTSSHSCEASIYIYERWNSVGKWVSMMVACKLLKYLLIMYQILCGKEPSQATRFTRISCCSVVITSDRRYEGRGFDS